MVRRPESFPLVLFLVGVLVSGAAAEVRGQSVQGMVRESGSQRPTPSAVVTLSDSTGAVHARVLSDAEGRFRLQAPGAGRYTISAEGMGLSPTSVALALNEDAVLGLVLSLDVAPVTLRGIDVDSERRCRIASGAGGAVQDVWDAVRAALSSNAVADGSGVMRYQVSRFTRRLDAEDLRVEEEQVVHRGIWAEKPFHSHGVDVLLDDGFARSEPGGAIYFAPDAEVLLSERFLDTHCFTLESGPDPDLVGLAFRPLDRRRSVTDVRGTLWVDRETGHLSHLDVAYVNPPGAAGWVGHAALGARVDFRDVGNGTWIVSEWAIRMPVVVSAPGPFGGAPRFRLAEITEEGGRVVSAFRGGTRLFTGESGGLTGRVEGVESPGWRVALVGTGRTVPVEDDGSFRFNDLPPGAYQVAVLDPRLLGLDRDVVVDQVEVAVGPPASRLLAPIPLEDRMEQICSEQAWSPHSAVLIGEVVDDRTGGGAGHAVVEASWQQVRSLDLRGERVDGTAEVRATRTDALGSFLLCGLPNEVPVSVAVGFQGRLNEVQVTVPQGRWVQALVVTIPDDRRGYLTVDGR